MLRRGRQRFRERRRRAAAAAGACLASLLLLGGCGDHTTPPASHSPAGVTVILAPHAGSIPVPRSFFGISTEYWGIDHFGRFMGDYQRVMSLLRTPGNGPFVLRIGGDSASHSVLDSTLRLPSSIFDVTSPWFHRVTQLVHTLRARLILDLNLITDTPAGAGHWAQAAMTQLPRGSLSDYEIANEPDLYTRTFWRAIFSPISKLVHELPANLTPAIYVQRFGAYARVLARISPRVGLAGPVVAYPNQALNWIAALLKGPHPGLKLVTAHEYPYSGCVTRLSPLYPTIDKILGEGASAGLAAAVKPAVLIAHRAGYPFRLTEMNSVTCGGLAGVSNTFATALWAPDALFEVMRTGANGVNVHVRAYAINGAFGLGTNRIVPHPLLYGLILFTKMLGPNARLMDLHLAASPDLHVKAWAVRIGRSQLRVLVINKGAHPLRAVLRLPATAPATVERLLAASPRATTGETLSGQQLGPRETWTGAPHIERIVRSAPGYRLDVPPYSAALVRVQTDARAR